MEHILWLNVFSIIKGPRYQMSLILPDMQKVDTTISVSPE